MTESMSARRLGLDFSGRQLLFGFIAGILAGNALALAAHAAVGVLDTPQAQLLAGEDLVMRWVLWLAVTGLTGGVFSLLVATRSYAKSAFWGLVYGAIVWALGPLLALHWAMGLSMRLGGWEPVNFVTHLLWGVLLATVYTWLLNTYAPEATVERRVGRPVV